MRCAASRLMPDLMHAGRYVALLASIETAIINRTGCRWVVSRLLQCCSVGGKVGRPGLLDDLLAKVSTMLGENECDACCLNRCTLEDPVLDSING